MVVESWISLFANYPLIDPAGKGFLTSQPGSKKSGACAKPSTQQATSLISRSDARSRRQVGPAQALGEGHTIRPQRASYPPALVGACAGPHLPPRPRTGPTPPPPDPLRRPPSAVRRPHPPALLGDTCRQGPGRNPLSTPPGSVLWRWLSLWRKVRYHLPTSQSRCEKTNEKVEASNRYLARGGRGGRLPRHVQIRGRTHHRDAAVGHPAVQPDLPRRRA